MHALSHIHQRRVFVDEIALRNILIAEGRGLQFSDFGQSVLLPLDTDMDTVCENDLSAKIEMLHLGWVIYSIATWRVSKYYYFEREELRWPETGDLPSTEDVFCGEIVRRCWRGSMGVWMFLRRRLLRCWGGECECDYCCVGS